MSTNNHAPSKLSFTAIDSAVGLVFGGLVGLLIDNMIIFAGGGLVLGAAADSRRKQNKLD